MANLLRGGFRPLYPGSYNCRRYEVDSNYGTALFPGDAVTLVTAGTVQALSAGGADLFLGVIAWVSYVSNGVRLFGNYVPANTVYSPTTRGSKNATYCAVWDDPSIEYVTSVSTVASATTAYAAVGANADILATAGDTIYRRSNHQLDGSTINTGTLRFRIVDMLRDPAQDLTAVNARYVVRINEGFHSWMSQAGI